MQPITIQHGLSNDQVIDNQLLYGKNTLPEKRELTLFEIFFIQFKSPLVYVLLLVAGITTYLKDYSDTIIIIVVVMFNSLIGTIQSHRTNNVVKSLKKMTKSIAHVIRDGKLTDLPIDEVTVGDIVSISAGDIIPSDGKLLEVHHLKIDESKINGESLPVEKLLTAEDPVVYRSTVVVSGNGIFQTTAVGEKTIIGELSKEILENVYNETVLEKKMRKLVKLILISVMITTVGMFITGLFMGRNLLLLFKTAVSLAVSAIPEGLPVVITVVLSIGAWRISKAKGLLKNLSSGATLATVSYICTDKTGTLTEGGITTKEIIPLDKKYSTSEILDFISHSIDIREISGEYTGDILDVTLYKYVDQKKNWQETKELPFTSELKHNAKEYIYGNRCIQVYKGAPEIFMSDSSAYLPYVHEGFRVLAVAIRIVDHGVDFAPQEAEAVALVIFEDKIRPDVSQAIAECLHTGIRIMMITGDNIDTATHVAKNVGIITNLNDDIVISGPQLREYSDDELLKTIHRIKVIARANPLDKLRIVKILQQQGEIVAMTGDGVNDGPSIALADIGIAMGKTGTEVAKEAADFILVTDSFSNITNGIFEARTIIENIKKTLVFLFSTSLGEIIIIVGTLVLQLPIALLPVQILWLNLITDGLLNLAMAAEPSESTFKKFNFKRYHGSILSRYDYGRVIVMALTMGIVSILVFIHFLDITTVIVSQTIMLVIMSLFQYFNAFNIRRHYDSILTYNPFSNKYITFALVVNIILLIISIITPLGQQLLSTTPFPPVWIMSLILLAGSILVTDELYKLTKNILNKYAIKKTV